MSDTLLFIGNTISTLANFVSTNPVCSVGFVVVSFHLIGFVIEHVKKLL